MILTCPVCATRYLVQRDAVPAEGREVRCVKCKNQWFATPQADEPPPVLQDLPGEEEEKPRTRPVPRGSSLPAIPKAASSKGWKIATAALLLIASMAALIALRQTLYPLLAPVYHRVGYYPTDGVMLADLKLIPLPKQDKLHAYDLQCTIINTAKEERQFPQFSLSIVDRTGRALAHEANFLNPDKATLKPGERFECVDLHFEHKFSTARAAIVTLGSPLEMALMSDTQPPQILATPEEDVADE
jgi:predicted Zn finger-like uncharacterized protein